MQIKMELVGDVTIFRPTGNFDGGKDCQKTTIQFQDLVAQGHRKFVICFEDIRWINSNGVGCLIAAKKIVDRVEGHIVLCHLNRRSFSTIQTMQLEELFTVTNNLKIALELLAPHEGQGHRAQTANAQTAESGGTGSKRAVEKDPDIFF